MLEIYTRYITGISGADALALSLNRDGFPFEDAQGNPCVVTRDHIRSTLAAWPAYAGNYNTGRAKKRAGYNDLDPDSLDLNPRRAVLNIDLVRLVAIKRKLRGTAPEADHGITEQATPLPLAQLVRCAACEAIAAKLGDPHRRTRLGGTVKSRAYYRHRQDIECGCHVHLIRQEVLEGEFVKLLARLRPNDEAFANLLAAAERIDLHIQERSAAEPDAEQQRLNQIKRGNEKIRRLRRDYQELHVTEGEYKKKRQRLEEQLQSLEGQRSDDVILDLPLVEFVTLLQHPVMLWASLDMSGQRALAHGLFDFFLYDIDNAQITRWQLSTWAQSLFTISSRFVISVYRKGG